MSQAGLAAVMERPMSVSQVVQRASEPLYDPWYPLKNWFRSAEQVCKQGNVYLREGNLQVAYFMLYRHAKLILEDLPKHPQAKEPQHRQNWVTAQADAEKGLKTLEQLKPRVNRRYESYLIKKKEAKEQAKAERKEEPEALADAAKSHGSAQILDPSEQSDLGIRIANARTVRQNKRHGMRISERTSSLQYPDDEDLETMMHNTRRQLDRGHGDSTPAASYTAADRDHISYNYPGVQRYDRGTPATGTSQYFSPSSNISSATSISAPPIPPKHLEDSISPPRPPPRSSAFPSPLPAMPFASSSSSSTPTPPPRIPQPVSRSATPGHALPAFKTTSALESGTPLRTLFLPSTLRRRFLSLAEKNTRANLETLGLLCGHLIRNALFITTLLLPPQESTSDTCEMTELGEVIVDEYISAHGAPDPEPTDEDNDAVKVRDEYGTSAGGDMIILGWIHTHPTQTCFLSSRDLHTHVWYQSDLPESIALVCAPSKGLGLGSAWDAFRLTDPPGMGVVKTCRTPGIFHLHDDVEGGIFTDVMRKDNGGHVREVDGLQFEVADLRSS